MAGSPRGRAVRRVGALTVTTTLFAGALVAAPPLTPPAAALGPSSRASTTATGAQVAAPSTTPVLSADGRYVAFLTSAALDATDTNGFVDVYRKDRTTGAVELVSRTDGEALGDADSAGEELAMSDDGTKIAFRSDASNLVLGDGNGQTDLFVRDLVAGTTKRVNVNDAGTVAGLGPDFFSLSADGNKIAFISYTSLDGALGGAYVRDVAAADTRFINQADGAQVAISGDGTKVAFDWSAPGAYEIYLHDDNDPALYRINYGTSSNYADPAGLVGPDAMSHDGNIIAFWSDGDAFGPVMSRPRAVYAYDHQANVSGAPFGDQIQRMSEGADGTDGDADSAGSTNNFPKGAVSADGTKVAFTSFASNLSPDAPSGALLVKNRTTDAIESGSEGLGGTAKPVTSSTLSADGTAVAFATDASDVVSGDTNGVSDVFVSSDVLAAVPSTPGDGILFAHTLEGNAFSISVARPDGTGLVPLNLDLGPGPNSDPVWSPDGRRIAFVSQRSGPFDAKVHVYDLVTGVETPLLATSTSYDADPVWDPSGTRLAFASDRSGSFDIWQVDVEPDGSGAPASLVNLTADEPWWDSFPAYAADGSLVFQSNRDGDFEIFRRSPVGALTQLTTNTVDDLQPAVAPDGTVALGRSGRIVLVPSGGGPETTVSAPAGATDKFPEWSPNGDALVYERTVAGASNVVVSQPDGSSVRTIAPTAGDGSEPHWFSGLSLTVSDRAVAASPRQVPFGAIPTQPASPATAAAVETGGLQIPASLVPLQITPSLVPLQITASLVGLQIPASLVPLQITASLVPLQITASLVGLQIPASLVPLQITASLVPAAIERLEATPFSTVRFQEPASAKTVLEGSTLAVRPFQELSLQDVLTDPVAGPRLRSLPFEQVDLSSALGDVGLGTLLLGDTTFGDIQSPSVDVCATLSGLGYGAPGECGGGAFATPDANGAPDPANAKSARPVDLALARVPFNDVDFPLHLHLVKMGEVDLAPNAALLDVPMARTDLLRTTDFGSIKVANLPASTKADSAVIDCTDGRCVGEATLYEAQLAGTLRASFSYRHLGATVDEFTLGSVVYGLAGAASVPYGDFTTEQLGLTGYQGADTQRVTYTARHRVGIADGGPLTVKLDLPSTFAPLSGAELTIDGASPSAPVVLDGPDSLSYVWNVTAPAGAEIVATAPVAPGVYLGEQRSDLTVTSAGRSLALDDVAAVRVEENDEPNETPAEATPIEPNTLYVGHAVGVDYFRLDVAPDQIVDIVLNNRESGDNDVVVYHPVDAAGVRPEDRLVANTSSDPTVLPLSETPEGTRYGEPVAGGTAQDIPLLSRPVAAIGDTRNRANERVSFRTLTTPGSSTSTYIVQVSSYLSQAANGPYTLFATTRPAPGVGPVCASRTGVTSADRPQGARAMPSVPAGTKTLLLVNQDRLTELYGESSVSAFLGRVDALASHPKVNGVVVPLDASATYRTKMGDWDAVPCDPLRANAVLRAGHDVLDSLVAASGADIRNIVILGGSEVIPKGYLPDATQVGNEAQFQAELSTLFPDNNSLIGSGQNLATDDPWGAVEARAYGARFVYPPVRAVGRLAERPEEMVVPIEHFLEPTVDGTLSRSTSSTFGAYFMKDLATAVDEAVARANANTAATARSVDASDGWTSASVRDALNVTDPASLISVHTHANPFGLAAPGDPAVPFRSNELDAAGEKLAGKVLLTIGCHTGTTVADVLFTTGTANDRGADFTQAATRNGALLLGQTGFGLGLEGSLAFSERLMTYLVEEIGRSRTIGEAFVTAKQRYLAAGLSSPYDEKALAELSLAGLSMFDFGTTATSPAPPASQTPTTTADPASGLQVASVTVTPSLRKVTAADGVYYEAQTHPTLGLGETNVAPERPVVPRIDLDVTNAAGVARGAWTTARTYATPEVVDPLIAAAALSGASASPVEPQPSDVVYPVVPLSVTRYQHATGGTRQRLTLLPSQFASTGKTDGKTVGRLRNTVSESVSVFYGPAVLTDATPPAITSVGAIKDGGNVRFVLRAADAESGVVRASVLYEDEAGVHLAELTRSGDDWTATAPFTGDEVLVEFRALNAEGLVGRAVDKSFGFLAVTAPPVPEGIVARVVGSPPVGGFYDATAKAEVSGVGRSFEYRLNDGSWAPYAAPVAITTPGVHRFSYRASDGASGLLVVPVRADTTPPTITVVSPADPATAKPGTVLPLTFSCADESGATCTAAAGGSSGLASGSTFVVPVGPSSVVITATDGAGNRSTKTISVTGEYGFEGFLSPVRNDAINRVNAGRTIPVKWRVHDAAGEVKTLSVVDVLSSKQIDCPSMLVIDLPVLQLTKSNLSYTGTHFEYGWKTSTSWAGQCRNFDVLLSDGTHHQATFKFT